MRPVRILFALTLVTVAACGTRVENDAAAPAAVSLPAGTVLPEIRPATAEQVLAAANAPGARATLVNVWATWCGPCREEFPDLVKIQRDYADSGLRVIFVSTDFPEEQEEARRFLARHGVSDTTLIKTGDDMHFIDTLAPRWTGALPATFIFDGSGRLKVFWEGRADYAKFQSRVQEVLHSTDPKEARS
jgi:thiol-disulfide isomerase/thioredoxin